MKPPTTETTIEQVFLHRGEVLTVWLLSNTNGEAGNIQQVELRVTPDGKCEVFCNASVYHSGEDWYAIHKD